MINLELRKGISFFCNMEITILQKFIWTIFECFKEKCVNDRVDIMIDELVSIRRECYNKRYKNENGGWT